MSRRAKKYLWDMRAACLLVLRFVEGRTWEDYRVDTMFRRRSSGRRDDARFGVGLGRTKARGQPATPRQQTEEAARQDAAIGANLKELGYDP